MGGFVGHFQDVSVDGQPFDTATRVEIVGTPPDPWSAQMVRSSQAEIQSGQSLLADVWARCETPSPGSDICQAPTELPEPQATEVLTVIDNLEQDEDVQKVFHTLV